MAFPAAIAFVTLLLQNPTSLEIRGERLEVAAPKIAQALGLPNLTISNQLRNEVIAMRATSLPRAEIQAKLCSLVNGVIIERKEGWVFDQTDAQRAEDAKNHRESRLKAFQQMVVECRKIVAKMSPFDEKAARDLQNELIALSKVTNATYNSGFHRRVNAIDRKGPLQRVGYQVAARLEAKDWMTLSKDRSVVVYSLNPTKMQLPLPVRVDDLLAEAIEGQNTWAAIGGGDHLQGPKVRSEDGGDEDGTYWLGTTNGSRNPISPSEVKNLIVKLSLENRSISVSAFGKNDERLFESNLSLYEFTMDETDNYDRTTYEQALAKRKPLTGDAKEFLSQLGMEKEQPKTYTLSDSLRQKLLNPELVDPVSISTYDVLDGAIQGKNFAFLLSDQMMGLNYFEPKLFSSSRGMEYKYSEDDKWITLTDEDPLKTREERVDRKKLGQILRFVDANKRQLSIEEKAAFYTALPREAANAYWMERLVSLVTPSPIRDTYTDPTGYRIYGSMSPGEREVAFKNPVPLGKLSSDLHKNLFQELFMSLYGSYPEVAYPDTQSQAEIQEYSKFMNKLYSGLMQEKTFLMPVGLTGEMTLKLSEATEQVLSCVSPMNSQYRHNRTMSPTHLGNYMFRKTNPKKYRWEVDRYNVIDEDRIWVSSKRSVTIKLNISKFVSFNWTLEQVTVADTKPYTAETLPPEILKLVKQGYKEAEEQDKYYNAMRPSQGRNPPPPSEL